MYGTNNSTAMKQATDKQISYLCSLARRVERIRKEYTALRLDVPFINWETEREKGVTTIDASIRIDAYKSIITGAQSKAILLGISRATAQRW